MGRLCFRPRGGVLTALGAALLAAACAVAPPPAPSPPPPLTAVEVESFAALLRLEDRREFAGPTLRAAAESPSAAVRARAALALGRLRAPEGLALLRPLLADADTAVAATAAFALGQLGDTAAVDALAAQLAAPSPTARPTVASEAAYALGKLRSERAHEALRALLAGSPTDDAGRVEPVGSALLAVWRHPRPRDLGPIVRWSRVPDAELRWRAAYALSRRPDPAAVPVLRQLASDPDPRVRAFAVRGLTAPLADSSGVGAAALLPLLAGATRDSAYEVRINAARALGSYTAPSAVAALLPLLTGEQRHEALAAAESLGRMGPPAAEAAGALRDLALTDSVPVALRQAAVEALARVSPAAAAPVAARLAGMSGWRLRASAARALLSPAVAAPAALDRLLHDRDPRVAAIALQAVIDAAGDTLRSARRLLLEGTGSPDVWVRATALGGLGRLADPADFPVLLDAYGRARRDSLNDAALAALDALAALRGTGVAPERAFFARFRRSPDPLVRLRARERFGATADSAWGDPLPLETGRTLEEYRQLVRRWVAPAPRQSPRVEIETGAGTLRLHLLAADAPLTSESLLRLAGGGYFDGQEWPRVVPNFVVQGGDPRGDTNGGPGYTIRDELNRHRYGAGSLGMALSGPDTGGSQFFVTHSSQPHLDGIYTLFGEVEDGQEVLRRILPGELIHRVRVIQGAP